MLLFGLKRICDWTLQFLGCTWHSRRSHTIPPARRLRQYDKSLQRWYLPKLRYWLSFSLDEVSRSETQ